MYAPSQRTPGRRAAWGLTVLLTLLKDPADRVFGSHRDLFYLFFVFLAVKLDYDAFSWHVTFVVSAP